MYKERKGGKHEEKVISRDSGTCTVFYKYAPQTIFAEEFTSGNQDVVSEEETPEIFTNEEQEAVGEQMRNCLYSVQKRFLNLMMPPMRQWLLRKMNKLEKLI